MNYETTKSYDRARFLFEKKTGMVFPPSLPTDIDIFRDDLRMEFFIGTKAEFRKYKKRG
jgi:hypothetical protein